VKRSHKKIFVLLTLLLAVIVLTGCGGITVEQEVLFSVEQGTVVDALDSETLPAELVEQFKQSNLALTDPQVEVTQEGLEWSVVVGNQEYLVQSNGTMIDVSESITVYSGGMFEPIAAPLRAVIVFFNDRVLAPLGVVYSWGWAIILVAIIIRGLLLPLSLKQMRSMKEAAAKTKALQPELDKLKKKYGKDKQRFQQEQQKLYQEHGIIQAQMAGCLPTLIQMPILFAFYYAILGLAADVGVPASGRLQGEPWYFIPDISLPEYRTGMTWLTQGLSFSDIGGSLQYLISPEVWPYLVLPILLAVSQFFMIRSSQASQPQTGGDGSNPAAGMMGQMSWLMTAMFVFFALQVPAGLSLYWVVGNGLALGQQLYVNQQKDRWEEDARLKTEAIKNNSKSSGDDDDETGSDKPAKEKTKKPKPPLTEQQKSGTRRKRRKRR